MKTYYNNINGKPLSTVGYPVDLQVSGEFAVVRPPYLNGHKDVCWQVIHVRTGYLITLTPERTRALAIKRALARIEGKIIERGEKWVNRRLMKETVPAIVKEYYK